MKLPPYMSLNHNTKARKASLSVLDRKQRKQREMWGMSSFGVPLIIKLRLSDSQRYDPRIHRQSHPWSFRRSCRYSEAGRSRIQSNSRALSGIRPTRVPWTAICFIEGRLLTPHRAWRPSGHESKHTTTYSNTLGRGGERGGKSVCGEAQEVEGAGAVQREGHLRERGDHQAQGEEDQMKYCTTSPF